MTCKEVCALLSDYVDGELNADVHQEMDAHLQTCNACTHDLDQLRKSLAILKRLREKDAPHNYVEFDS